MPESIRTAPPRHPTALDLYFKEIKSVEPLTPEEEVELARRIREQLNLANQIELPGFEIPDDAVLGDLGEDLLD